ncbi:hypothetical protein OESDEN_10280 [Oesophagostomum dentatum]|uniref:Copine C-terminal domain-containing protein n=1 Tax=Oesophagostomum dentatum TaxID=61180 RepID=A0A0B1T155_OESDE|nr:hypothetical protein OESDEN_10280 [Oesophagostomum dentatum]
MSWELPYELSAAVNNASDAPLSIIIVGIGSGDFSQLLKLAAKRKEGTRACLQFIAMAEILEYGDPPSENRSRIAQQALRAIPEQMTDFMHTANIAAKPPIQVCSCRIELLCLCVSSKKHKFQVCRSPLFHSSSLIPDRPTQFVFDGVLPTSLTPQLPRSDRRGSDSQYLDVEIGARNSLAVRVPERCHSVLQTTREQYQRRLKERGLGKVSSSHDALPSRGPLNAGVKRINPGQHTLTDIAAIHKSVKH